MLQRAPARVRLPDVRQWRVDPIGPALAVLAAVIYAVQGFNGYLSRDLALYAYAGQQVADGVPPYEGVINRLGPLAHLVPGAGALAGRVLGVDEVLAMRVWFLVLSAAAIWVAYLAGRVLLSSRVAGVATAVALLAVSGFNTYATNGPREKTTMVLLLLCAMLAVGYRRFGWAGVFVSLATLTWQPALFVGAPFAVAALWALPRGVRLRSFGRFVIGGLVPLAVFLVWYAAMGKLRLFLDCFVLIHAQYTDQPGAESDLSEVWDLLREVYGVFMWAIVIGAVALVVGALLTLVIPSRRRDPEHRVVVAAALGLVVGVLWTLRVFNGWPDIFCLLPMTVFGVGYLARQVRDLVDPRVAIALVATWAVIASVGEYHHSVDDRSDVLQTQRREVRAVFDILPPDATMVAVEAPQALVFSGRTNPFPQQIFDFGMDDYVDATYPGGLDGFADDIEEMSPTLIARGTTEPSWLMPVLAENYISFGTTPGFTWYVNRSVDTDTRIQLQEAVRGGEMDPKDMPVGE